MNVIFVLKLQISCQTSQNLKELFFGVMANIISAVQDSSCSLFANFVAACDLFLLHI